jgi:hypothetical protein
MARKNEFAAKTLHEIIIVISISNSYQQAMLYTYKHKLGLNGTHTLRLSKMNEKKMYISAFQFTGCSLMQYK